MKDLKGNAREERVIHRVLERQAQRYGDRPFLYFKEKTFSFRQVNEMTDVMAAGLQQIGVKKGDKVAIMLGNSPEYLFLWWGLSKLGAVEVPVNTAHKGDLLSYILSQSDSVMVVIEKQYLDRIMFIRKEIPSVRWIVVLDDAGNKPDSVAGVITWGELTKNDGTYRREDVFWDDPFVVLYTSGTTGASKGGLMPQNYGLFMADMTCEAAGQYTEDDCLYCALPLFHGNAQVLSSLPALVSGARLVLAERFSASRFWTEVKRYGCTEFNYIGGIIPILYNAEGRPDDADNPLRVMVGAGAPKNITEAFEKRFGVTLVENYGTTEIGSPLTSTPTVRKIGSCGRVHKDYMCKLVDDAGVEVGPNEAGELLVRPLKPNCMMLEYYKMPDKTVDVWRDLWFHTGDYLSHDEDGYYYFLDRKKDALRRRGENISSYEVEKTINSHPAVLESAVIAAKADLGEDDVMVCVALKPGASLAPEELIEYCVDRMAYFMVPRFVRFMAALPKTPTERVRKFQLREEGVTPDTWDIEKSGMKIKR